ncbi:hypothetical protein EC844_10210 [Acinetobacter calcoaceticus]|uniref:Copper resistance protein C n=1 Tax=Acinetobacter calcoaceticus TaxID=471 RepID=A0A4R1Y2G2_ACICA|nr:hypothetical protein EC844_10210 [Acinetobacter calcoaceticus]
MRMPALFQPRYCVILLGSALCLNTTQTFAHTQLQRSIPAANATVTTTPKSIQLQFAEPVMLMGLKLKDANNNAINIKYKPNSKSTAQHIVTLPALKNGVYQVTWNILAQDGHAIKGQYSFTLKLKP